MGLFDILSDILDAEPSKNLIEHKSNIINIASNITKISRLTGSAHGFWLGKSFAEWNSEWESIGPLISADLSPYNRYVGLYMHLINGKTMYIGRAIELYNGGFRKRLSDYRRESNSARKHTSGKTINAHLNEIETCLLIVGNTPNAVIATKEMEPVFIQYYSPPWNKQYN